MTAPHADGPGLKVLGASKWYGGGYCGICGHRETDPARSCSPLVPVRVRWWDPDDGWKSGVLCMGCGEEAARRGPEFEDFAVTTAERAEITGKHLTVGDFLALSPDAHFVRLVTRIEEEGILRRVTFNEGAPLRVLRDGNILIVDGIRGEVLDAITQANQGDDDAAHTQSEDT